jgi:hypothetical protein
MPVPNTSTDRLLALWESGVPLDWAWIDFAVFFDRFAFRALRTHPTNDPDVLGLEHPRYKELSHGWLPKTWEARQKKLAIVTQNERINLLGQIYGGRLWSIGFWTLTSGSDQLVRVPRQHFFFDEAGEREHRPDIYWGKSELTVGDTSYFDIRIVRAPFGEQPVARPSAAATSDGDGSNAKASRPKARRSKSQTKNPAKKRHRKKTGGRPKTSDWISRTTRRLWKTNPGFRTLPLKGMAPEVRAAILGENRRHEETSGYRSSSMAKIIGHELSALRKQSKRNKPNKPRSA